MPDFRSEFVAHAEQMAPAEACALVVNGSFWPCRNIAENPELDFAINPVDMAAAMLTGVVSAVLHSHPMGGKPSAVDRRVCKQSGLPWLVWSMPDETWHELSP